MATAVCDECEKSYYYPDGSKSSGFCSDRCFGKHALKVYKRPLWKKALIVVLAAGAVTAVVFRREVAYQVMLASPGAADPACSFLAHQGQEGAGLLCQAVLEQQGPVRIAALSALERVSDTEAGREGVLPHLPALGKIRNSLPKDQEGLLLVGLGRCKIKEQLEDLIEMLKLPDLAPSAVKALGYLGDMRAAEPLNQILTDPDASEEKLALKSEAAVALGRTPDSERRALPGLSAMLESPKPADRERATEAIAALTSDAFDLKQRLKTASDTDRPGLMGVVGRIDAAMAALNKVGPKEGDKGIKKKMGDAIAGMTGADAPDWASN